MGGGESKLKDAVERWIASEQHLEYHNVLILQPWWETTKDKEELDDVKSLTSPEVSILYGYYSVEAHDRPAFANLREWALLQHHVIKLPQTLYRRLHFIVISPELNYHCWETYLSDVLEASDLLPFKLSPIRIVVEVKVDLLNNKKQINNNSLPSVVFINDMQTTKSKIMDDLLSGVIELKEAERLLKAISSCENCLKNYVQSLESIAHQIEWESGMRSIDMTESQWSNVYSQL